MFKITKKSHISNARLATLKTAHGRIKTPFFMPIATKASIKALQSSELKNLNAQILLSNTYHLYLQPGMQTIKKAGGLHNFMNWHGPILTDSGGYQVFSLSGAGGKKYSSQLKDNQSFSNHTNLIKIISRGVEFKSFIDGSKHFFTPSKVQYIQDIIGSDIKMVLDVCSSYPTTKIQAAQDTTLTHLWAQEALNYHKSKSSSSSLLFGIIQGSVFKDLRIQSAQFLSNLDFDGYAIGGLAVGEEAKQMYTVLDYLIDYLPLRKPRYLMGVGKPENIIQAVKRGVDMFDCVIPTREARHGRLYKFSDNQKFNYQIVNIFNAKFKSNFATLDKNCSCSLCQNYSLSYLYHLFKSGEPLAIRLASLHNLKFYLDIFSRIRSEIRQGKM